MKQLWKKEILSRVPCFWYLVCRLLGPFFWLHRALRTPKTLRETRLCIEAGIEGWKIIEYEELYQSAVEYLGADKVAKLEVTPEVNYLTQVREVIEKELPTHYAYSPRTGSENKFEGFWQAVRISILLYTRRIVPIVFLADFHFRPFRTQAFIVSALNGLVVTVVSPKTISPILPHRRILGPHMMPFSLRSLKNLRLKYEGTKREILNEVVFSGSLYEPRTTILGEMKKKLAEQGIEFKIMTRLPGEERVPSEEYWERLSSGRIVVTTAEQTEMPGVDWPWVLHLVYRYFEVLACGSVLVAPKFEGVGKCFRPDVDFMSFQDVDDAVAGIVDLLSDESKLEDIRRSGMKRVESLVESEAFWGGIDGCLGPDSMK